MTGTTQKWFDSANLNSIAFDTGYQAVYGQKTDEQMTGCNDWQGVEFLTSAQRNSCSVGEVGFVRHPLICGTVHLMWFKTAEQTDETQP
jgi:hypothetical protein